MADFDGVKFELVALVADKTPEWKIGFFVPKVELCDMMEDFLDVQILDGCWLKDVEYSKCFLFR